MAVKTYSKKKDGNKRPYKDSKTRCKYFAVAEFACPGSDTVKIDTALVAKLDQIREYFGGRVVINSGYRSPSYNASIGGYKYSNHVSGKAADIVVYRKTGSRVPPQEVMIYLWRTGWKEGGCMNTATHVGVRDNRYFMEERGKATSNGYPKISDVPSYFDVRYKTKQKLRVRETYKTGAEVVDWLDKGESIYFERVFKNKGRTWGRLQNGKFVLIKSLIGKTYCRKV